MIYQELIAESSPSGFLTDLLHARIPYPNEGIFCPAQNLYHPLALMPIATDPCLWSLYGLWKHWWGRRECPIVRLDLTRQRVCEIARNEEQFLAYLINFRLSFLAEPDEITDDIRALMAYLPQRVASQLVSLHFEFGDIGLHLLDTIEAQPPLSVAQEAKRAYNGELPTADSIQPFAEGEKLTCGWEVPEECEGSFRGRETWPIVIAPTLKVVETCCRQGDLDRAWMALNSPRWELEDLIEATHLFRDYNPHAPLKRRIEAWLESTEDPDFRLWA